MRAISNGMTLFLPDNSIAFVFTDEWQMADFMQITGRTLRACLHGGGGPRSSGVDFFCFHALGDTKQKKPTPLDRGPPLHVNRV